MSTTDTATTPTPTPPTMNPSTVIADYISKLNLGKQGWQVYETGRGDGHCFGCVSVFDGAGFELQLVVEVPDDGTPTRLIPGRIFESQGREALSGRGRCVWFNPEEFEASAIEAHNANTTTRQEVEA
jgi:hypothetical protein